MGRFAQIFSWKDLMKKEGRIPPSWRTELRDSHHLHWISHVNWVKRIISHGTWENGFSSLHLFALDSDDTTTTKQPSSFIYLSSQTMVQSANYIFINIISHHGLSFSFYLTYARNFLTLFFAFRVLSQTIESINAIWGRTYHILKSHL